jgi:hypothetical protein
MFVARQEQKQSRRTSDCHVLRRTLPTARESKVEVSTYDDKNDKWEFGCGRVNSPHFQFQTSATSAEGEAIRIEMVRFLLPVEGVFGWETKQEFPISFGLNSKGGMDDDEFFEYIQKTIMKLFPDAAPVRGRWVILKCDSGLGRLNPTLLAYHRFHGFILYPGVPNTTAVTKETDQSYGPFQTAVRTNLQVIID